MRFEPLPSSDGIARHHRAIFANGCLEDHQQNKRFTPSSPLAVATVRQIHLYTRSPPIRATFNTRRQHCRTAIAFTRTRCQTPPSVYFLLAPGTPLYGSLSLPGWRQIWIQSRKPVLRPKADLFLVTKSACTSIMKATRCAITTVKMKKTFRFLRTPNMPSRPLLPSWPSTFRHNTTRSAT
jgi:hypothetical protein